MASMIGKRGGLALVSLALTLSVGLAVSGTAAAKKKGGGKAAIVKGSVGAIPNGPQETSPATPLRATAQVGKKFKGKRVGDVDVTISLSGVSAPGRTCGSLCDLVVRLSAPNGATTALLSGGTGNGGLTGNTVTRLTVSDQTPTSTCGVASDGTPPPPPCQTPYATLLPPYTGIAMPSGGAMNLLNGSPMKGTWTLTAFDFCGGPPNPVCTDEGTVSLTAWSLRISPTKAPK
jgi:hypothetical protein